MEHTAQVEIYYASPSDKKLDILKKFTHEPVLFKHMDLINEMENLSIGGASEGDMTAKAGK